MTRNQKLALAGSLTLLVVLGLFAAYLLGTSSGDSTAGSSTPGSSTPSSGPTSGPPSSQPPAPVTVDSIKLFSGPSTNGGWGTDVALVFGGGVDSGPGNASQQPQMTITPGNGEGEYDVTFDREVTIHQSAIDRVDAQASRLLMRLNWDPALHELQIYQSAFTANITKTVVGTAGGIATTVEFVRTPLPATTHDCIEIDKPVPYTALFGLSKVTGFAELFEAGPMTVVARVPGKGQKTIKVKTAASTRQPFSADLELPLLDAPAEGYVAAYDNSAKDGSPICLVKIPVYMSPGG
jgi:Immunoglobulin-like domain of bacterial spore germination